MKWIVKKYVPDGCGYGSRCHRGYGNYTWDDKDQICHEGCVPLAHIRFEHVLLLFAWQ